MKYTEGDKVIESRDCGCLIFERHSIVSDETRTDIHYCSRHEAAFPMYGSLKTIMEHFRHNDPHYFKSAWYTDARETIDKAEGK